MIQRYCHSCGAPIPRTERRPAALCKRCTVSGPQTDRARRRWSVRTVGGGTRGPLSHEALVDQLLRGALGPVDLAVRQGGTWKPIIEHPDLQSFFLPGNHDADRLVGSQDRRRQERRSDDARRMAGFTASMVAAVAALGVATYAIQNDLFVVPEEIVDEITEAFGNTSAAVTEQVARAVDESAAVEEMELMRNLPGGEVLRALQERWPNAAGAPNLRLHRGRIGLWSGVQSERLDAREHLEQAVILAPEDVETWSALGELYALLLVDEPELSEPLTLVVDRVSAMAPASVAASRTAALASFAHGNRGAAADTANRCAASPGTAGQVGSNTDLGCALVASEAQGLLTDLAALASRYPEEPRVMLAYARVLVEKQHLRDAVEVATALKRQYPDEAAPLVVLFDAYVALAEWDNALKAGRQVAQVSPGTIRVRVGVAEIALKVKGAAGTAVEMYQEAIAHEKFAMYPERNRVFNDAASAAVAAGRYDDAVALADRALALAERDAIAGLHKARALQMQGKSSEAEALLRATEPTLLEGHTLARWHVAAAVFYIEAGRERLAESELRSAGESDAFWPRVPLQAARNRLAVGDREGAISFLEQAAFMNIYSDEARDPLQNVWADDTDWKAFRRDLETELLGDVRFASRGYGVIGVVSMVGNLSDSRRVLERALVGGAEAPAANAALAQLHMRSGNTALAIKHSSQVVDTSANPGVLYGVRGRAMAQKGDAAQSRAAFVQALEKAPNEPTLYRWRAESQLVANDRRGARKSLGEALRLMPDDFQSRLMLVALKDGGR